MKRTSLLILLSICFCLHSYSQDLYSGKWKRIDSLLQQEGLTETANKEVDAIIKAARNSNNQAQVIKGLQYKASLDMEKNEQALERSIRRLESELKNTSQPGKSVMQSLLAESYWNYLQQNRYRLYNNSNVPTSDKNDLASWSLQDITAKVRTLYQQSISAPQLLQKIPVATFDAIIEKGNARKYRPTIYDLLAHRALDYFKNDESGISRPATRFQVDRNDFFASAADFIKIQFRTDDTTSHTFISLKIFQQLLKIHSNDNDLAAEVDTDIERIAFVHQQAALPNKDSLYLNALEQLLSSHANEPAADQAAYLVAEFYASRAARYDPITDTVHKNDYTKALQVLDNVIAMKHKSEGFSNAANLRNQILAISLSARMEAVNLPGQPFRIMVEYKNASKLYYRLLRIDSAKRDSFTNRTWEDEFWRRLTGLPYIISSSVALPTVDDHQLHRVEIGLDALPVGEYALLTSNSADFQLNPTNPFSLNRFWVSSISYIQSQTNFYVLDRESGKPLEGATATVYQLLRANQKTSPAWQEITSKKTDANGKFSFVDNPEEYTQKKIEFRYKNDFLVNDYQRVYYSYNNNEEELTDTDATEFEEEGTQAFLFTDRSIYRPGQQVFFKGIYITKDFKTKQPKIITGLKSMMYLVDGNGQLKDSVFLTSNQYGSVTGTFTLPAGLLNGEFRITDKETNASVSISVEEYKRPKFMVELKMPGGSFRVNDSITVHGTAKAFAGSSIGGATLNYKVVRRTILPIWIRYQPGKIWPPRRREETVITVGSTQTSATGEFTIAFVAQPDTETDQSLYPTFNYEVQADVIDINGESHSSNLSVVAGYQSIQIDMNLPESMYADSLRSLAISTTNLNGVFERSLLQVQFTQLIEPGAVYRKRYWQQPDQFVYSEAEFHKLFPTDEYVHESSPGQWSKGGIAMTIRDSSSTKSIPLSKTLGAGYYEVQVIAFSSSGDTIRRKQIIHLTGGKVQQGDAYVYLQGQTSSLKLNDEWSQRVLTNMNDIYLVKQFAINEQVSPASIQLIKNDFTEKGVTINQYGNARYDIAFVRNNRFYTQSILMPIVDETKKLSINLTSFRNKVMPGSREIWKLKVVGSTGEKVASEILTGMYDRSLDQFTPHTWQPPSIWNSPLANSSFVAPSNFQLAGQQQRYIQQEQAPYFEKTYDRIAGQGYANQTIKALSGRLSGVDVAQEGLSEVVVTAVAQEKQAAKAEDSVVKPVAPTTPPVQVRKDFRETAFLFPALSTDSSGNIEFTYTMPEALTSWKWMTLAHTKDLAFGYKEAEIVSQKELMVQPNLPRFLREGDRIDLKTRIVNMSDKEMTGQVQLELIDPETNQSVDGWFRNVFPNQYFTVAPGESSVASFSLEVPFQYAKPVIYRFTASNNGISDGEEGIIPVLLSKIMVTETATLPLFNQTKKQVRLEKLLKSGTSETLTSQSLTVEFTSNPSWFAIQSLPHLADIKDGSSEQVFYRIYAGALSRKIIESNPQIAAVYEKWKHSDTSMLSKLEQNEALKSVLLQQTPWVLEAKNESDNIAKVAEMFRYWKVQQNLLDAVTQLKSLQNADGSFSWMNGGPADRFVTQNILVGIGRLMHMNALNKDLVDQLNDVVAAAMPYIDNELVKDFNRQKKSAGKLVAIDPIQVQYLYLRSFFPSKPVDGKTFSAYNNYRKLSTSAWVKLSRQLQGMTAVSLYRTGDKANAARILRSLKENALNSEEFGTYWKESNFYYSWFISSVSTQSVLIETFNELTKDTTFIDRMKLWLIKNKQTNSWPGDKSTADACYALLNSGTAWINNDARVEIQLGSLKIQPSTSEMQAGTGYFKNMIEGSKIKPEMGEISVSVKSGNSRQPMYGAVYWKYMEDLDKITAGKSPVVVKKRIFSQTSTSAGIVYKELPENATLKVGDKVLVRLEVKSDRALQYVHLSDMRASGFEPLTTLSGYQWRSGLSYYQVTRDASHDFYIDHLPRGSFQLEYELQVNNSGSFTNGISTIQCLYAPEFTGHSTSIRFHAENE